ncbi:MAG: MaoC family dehydratase [Acidimicrobiia bacterium]|nr:MaoC family dehydratase [Acidimicrobiia bacterium]
MRIVSVVESLRDRVGEAIGVSEWFTISQERIQQFADATDDQQWIHVNADKAATGPFGTTIAHGFLTLSLIPALAPGLDLPGVRMGVNYGLDRVRFISPVPSGSRIRAHSKLLSVDEVPGGVQAKIEVTIELEGSEKPACVAETLTRLYL